MKKNLSMKSQALDGALFKTMMISAADYFEGYKDEINDLNVFPVPDGDTGDNMYATVKSGALALSSFSGGRICEALAKVKSGMLLGARGNSGVILSQLFAGLSDGLDGIGEARISDLKAGMKKGVERAYDAVGAPKEGTILTVAKDGVIYANEANTSSIADYFRALAEGMRLSLDRTPELLPMLKDAGVVDSGGAGLYRLFLGLSLVLNGEISLSEKGAAESIPTLDFENESILKYGYCTELLVRLDSSKCDPNDFSIDSLREFLGSIGDSVVAFSEGNTVKLHVHTFSPHEVLEYMEKRGVLMQVKIENMSIGHSASGIASMQSSAKKSAKGRTKKADLSAPVTRNFKIIAVSQNSTQTELLRSVGADIILSAKRGESPSAKNFFDKIRASKSEGVIIFPNDKNAILSAKQAAELSEDKKIHVIPSTNIAECYASLSLAAPDSHIHELKECFERTLGRIRCAVLSTSIKSCSLDGVNIKRGDTVAIINNKIVCSHKERVECALESLAMLITDSHSMLTVHRGKEASKRECRKIIDSLKERYPEVEIYEIYSAEDIYPYIFAAE